MLIWRSNYLGILPLCFTLVISLSFSQFFCSCLSLLLHHSLFLSLSFSAFLSLSLSISVPFRLCLSQPLSLTPSLYFSLSRSPSLTILLCLCLSLLNLVSLFIFYHNTPHNLNQISVSDHLQYYYSIHSTFGKIVANQRFRFDARQRLILLSNSTQKIGRHNFQFLK